MILGGTDVKHMDSSTRFLWVLEPLLQQQPQWIKIPINDKEHILPDGLKRHQLVVRPFGNQIHLLVIGGEQRTFHESSRIFKTFHPG